MNIPDAARRQAQDLLDFIDASPSPWHAVSTCEQRLQAAGFSPLQETERWSLRAGDKRYVVRGGSSIIAFIVGSMLRLGVEVYGGPILATFADRDLSLAGRVMVRTANGPASRLVRFAAPLLRLPNLAIHMNREVNESGLKFNKQTELPLLLGVSADGCTAEARFREP